MDDLLKKAYEFYKNGNRNEAVTLLIALVKQEPNNEKAWYALGVCVEEPQRKIYCVKKTLSIDPYHQNAQLALEKLTKLTSVIPTDNAQNQVSSLKKCPYCSKMIEPSSIACRFCGRALLAIAPSNTKQVPFSPKVINDNTKANTTYAKKNSILFSSPTLTVNDKFLEFSDKKVPMEKISGRNIDNNNNVGCGIAGAFGFSVLLFAASSDTFLGDTEIAQYIFWAGGILFMILGFWGIFNAIEMKNKNIGLVTLTTTDQEKYTIRTERVDEASESINRGVKLAKQKTIDSFQPKEPVSEMHSITPKTIKTNMSVTENDSFQAKKPVSKPLAPTLTTDFIENETVFYNENGFWLSNTRLTYKTISLNRKDVIKFRREFNVKWWVWLFSPAVGVATYALISMAAANGAGIYLLIGFALGGLQLISWIYKISTEYHYYIETKQRGWVEFYSTKDSVDDQKITSALFNIFTEQKTAS